MLFPEPVSPIITTTVFSSTAFMIVSSNWRIGRSAIDRIAKLQNCRVTGKKNRVFENYLQEN